ncbi:MAG: restriction endonuclease [Ruminococcaceae bacterium]|nr:restriction endonuclease [Oscillospiraceae bacterium]
MFNKEKLADVLSAYKKRFDIQWKDEKYKWEAARHFQDNWDIDADDFLEMFMRSTEKMFNLLASMNNYPRGMIKEFAKADSKTVREMFVNLYNEDLPLTERIDTFRNKAEELRLKYNPGSWNNHYQSTNAISVYLWARFPEKYYIYKYSEVRAAAKELESDFVPKKTADADNLIESYKFYDEICSELLKEHSIISILSCAKDKECYPDHDFRTLTADIAFYINRNYKNDTEPWFPKDYTPGFSVKQWVDLLNDGTIFTESSLEIMKRMKDYGGAATCKELSENYGENVNFYNSGSSFLAKRIAQKTGCPVMERDTENSRWWPILYIGRSADKYTSGSYIWKLRDELKQALDIVDLSHVKLYVDFNEEQEEPIKDKYTKQDFLNEVYLSEADYDTLKELLDHKQNIILQGAPGVGKTYAAKRLAYSIMGEKDDSRIEFIQFHQNYSYEDFIMGYKPNADGGFELKNGIFYTFCNKAKNDPDRKYFFIIDEINRGNMSKIFGELLMLIEKDYRKEAAKLAYTGKEFNVPENLYLIGMMNTADRSLAMIDYALRRRFAFFTMTPGFDSDGFKKYKAELENPMFDELIKKVCELNETIKKDDSLGEGFLIGHSYFCSLKKDTCTKEKLRMIVKYDIIPTLKEYWFDNKAEADKHSNELTGVING